LSAPGEMRQDRDGASRPRVIRPALLKHLEVPFETA